MSHFVLEFEINILVWKKDFHSESEGDKFYFVLQGHAFNRFGLP